MKTAFTMNRALRMVRDAYLMLGIALLMSASLEVGGRAIRRLGHRKDVDPRARADAYQGAPWATAALEELAACSQVEWQPYLHWRRTPFHGTHVNVEEDGRRRTWNPAPAPHPPRIVFLGGSTMWGTGVRDEFTIPSLVSKRLEASQHAGAIVVNEGESGYVSTQELFLLQLRLRKGEVPDVVVFLDGVNDVFSAYQNHAAGVPHNESSRRREFNLLKRPGDLWLEGFRTLVKSSVFYQVTQPTPHSVPLEASEATRLAADVASVYARNVEQARALAKAQGFEALFFLQPVVFTKQPLSAYEQIDAEERRPLRDFSLDCYRRCASALSLVPGFHDVSGIFANDPEPRFLDFCHLGESGNDAIAARIVPAIEAALAPRLLTSRSAGR